MSQHGDDVSVEEKDCCCEFADLEVYSSCATTESVSEDDQGNIQVEVDLDEEKLQEIYDESAISSEYTYEEFKEKVQEEADKAASQAYPAIRDTNKTWEEVGGWAQRIIKVRLCIPVGFVRIYICWKP